MYRISLENVTKFVKGYPALLLQGLKKIAGDDGGRIYLVGGTVRDWLLGRQSHDLDLAVAGKAENCAKQLQRELGGGTLVDLSGPDDQAVRLVWRGEQCDFSSFRNGTATIEDDVRLRDFTVNAMAVELSPLLAEIPDCSIIDPTGGFKDLQQGVVRHCPGAFVADPVRMLRGYRLCAGFGFQLDLATREAIRREAHLIKNIAVERISYELQLIFESPRTSVTLQMMAETGLLRQLLPELYFGEGVEQPEFHHLDVLDHCFLALEKMEAIIRHPDQFFPGHGERIASYLKDEKTGRYLKWAALLHDIGKPETRECRADRVTFYRHDEVGKELFVRFAERSKWSKADRDQVSALIGMHMHPFHLCNVQREDDISKRAALKLCRRAEGALIGLFLLAMSDSLASSGEKKPERMEDELLILFDKVWKLYEEKIAPVLLGPRLITGKDLIEQFRLEPGPLFAEILGELEAARVEQKVIDRRSALAWVEEFLLLKDRQLD